jgi:hypothetical protein
MYTIQSVSIEVASRSSTNLETITTYLSQSAEVNVLCASAHVLSLTQQDLEQMNALCLDVLQDGHMKFDFPHIT